jgi:hypothetical protein
MAPRKWLCRGWPAVVLILLSAPQITAQDLIDTHASVGLAGTSDSTTPKNLSSQETLAIATTSSVFDLYTSVTANNDQKYGPDIANFKSGKTLFNNYYFIDEGYMALKAIPRMTFSAGRYAQKDDVDSPYSLFFNSGQLAASGVTIRYEDDGFLFEDKWISLSSRSNFATAQTPPAWASGSYTPIPGGGTYNGLGLSGFPDRGSDYKAFIFKRGTMRFGFQDSVTYSGRNFDPNYFFSPVPQYFTQYFYAISGRPWSTSWTDKYAMGAFWDWKEADFDALAQVLVNDFSLHFLLPSLVPDNPWKMAWNFGGSMATPWGRFGLYQAGALKYTFEPITFSHQPVQNAVGYTYAPDVVYWLENGFEAQKIEDNSVGYLHGENNLALMATWDYQWARNIRSRSTLEYLIAGSNSPANAWQGASGATGTQLLNDALLEHQVTVSSNWQLDTGSWTLFFHMLGGVAVNPLTLEYPNADGTSALSHLIQIYVPKKGIQWIEELSIGGRYSFDVSSWFKP